MKPAVNLDINVEARTVRCGQCGDYMGSVEHDFGYLAVLYPGYEPKGDWFAMGRRGKSRIRELKEQAASGLDPETRRRARDILKSGNIKPYSRAPERESAMKVRYRKPGRGGTGGTAMRGESSEIGSFRGQHHLHSGDRVECAGCGTINGVAQYR